MKPTKYLFMMAVMASLGLLAAGCTGTVASSSSLQREVDVLKMEVANLKDQGRTGSFGGSASSDVRMDVDRLKTDVQRLNENVETATLGGLSLRQQLEYISARLDRLEKKAGLGRLDPKVVANVGSGIPVASSADYGTPSNNYDGGSSAPQPTVVTDYDEGKNFFEGKNYPAATNKFKAYIKAEPKGANAAAAQFYIGECYFAQSNLEEAILEYQLVVESYPKSPQVSTALLKQGQAFQALGDKESAKLLYQKVVKSYPKSYAAGIAKERLKTL